MAASNLFVLDCSLTMTWCFKDEATAYSRKVLQQLATQDAIVPSLWALEVSNVLIMAEKKKRITQAQSSRFLGLLSDLSIGFDEIPPSITHTRAISQIARDFDLTVYDAAYLEIAVRRGAPIATLDKAMKSAAKKIGVALHE